MKRILFALFFCFLSLGAWCQSFDIVPNFSFKFPLEGVWIDTNLNGSIEYKEDVLEQFSAPGTLEFLIVDIEGDVNCVVGFFPPKDSNVLPFMYNGNGVSISFVNGSYFLADKDGNNLLQLLKRDNDKFLFCVIDPSIIDNDSSPSPQNN